MNKFTEFYFLADKKNHNTEELLNELSHFNLEQKYKNKIFSPECRQAMLCIANGSKRKYIRTSKGSLHANDCTLDIEEYSVNETKKIDIQSDKGREIIKQSINKIMNSLCNNDNNIETDKNLCSSENKQINVQKKQFCNNTKPKIITRKQLTKKAISETVNDDQPYVFYNTKVYIKTQELYGKNFIRCYDTNQKLICSITILKKPFNYLMNNQKISENKLYKIVVFTKFECNDNKYFNSSQNYQIIHSDLISIRESD